MKLFLIVLEALLDFAHFETLTLKPLFRNDVFEVTICLAQVAIIASTKIEDVLAEIGLISDSAIFLDVFVKKKFTPKSHIGKMAEERLGCLGGIRVGGMIDTFCHLTFVFI